MQIKFSEELNKQIEEYKQIMEEKEKKVTKNNEELAKVSKEIADYQKAIEDETDIDKQMELDEEMNRLQKKKTYIQSNIDKFQNGNKTYEKSLKDKIITKATQEIKQSQQNELARIKEEIQKSADEQRQMAAEIHQANEAGFNAHDELSDIIGGYYEKKPGGYIRNKSYIYSQSLPEVDAATSQELNRLIRGRS